MSAKEDDEIEQPPMSYFIINKYALGVAIVSFATGFYCAHHYYNPDPPEVELPEQTSAVIKEILQKPCVDVIVKASEKTQLRCNDPRARAKVELSYHGPTFLVCNCAPTLIDNFK
jgi:hypothetical protein